MKTPREAPRDTAKRALAACTRALAGDRRLDVVFSRSNTALAETSARLPEPPASLDATGLAALRGLGDALALRHAHHDAALHNRIAPSNPRLRELHDALEQVRVEAIGTLGMRGVANNLAAALEHAVAQRQIRDVRERAAAPFDVALALMVRERITGLPPPASGAATVALWREWMVQQLGPLLDALPPYVHDQTAFAQVVAEHFPALEMHVLSDDGAHGAEERRGQQDSADDTHAAQYPDNAEGTLREAHARADAVTAEAPAKPDAPEVRRGAPARLGAAGGRSSVDAGYRIFTTAFDQVVTASALRTPEELQRLRGALDRQRARSRVAVGRLAARLQRHLMARQNRSWVFDRDEGELDATRLARIITDPSQSLSFRQEHPGHFRDTTVTLLVDNSGSMHGRAIAMAATCADMLAGTLERCGVRVEILGFTTVAWGGGQARERWLKAGKPAHPGRLNPTCHIIYKPADRPWRRAKAHLGLMLCDALLKENIDGEALLWAHQRLLARPEQRRVLMVISDGAPADDATLACNPRDYLEHHLRTVIGGIEQRARVELVAVGIGHDVGRYYARSATIADPDQLAHALTDQLVRLFDREGSRRRPAAAPGSA